MEKEYKEIILPEQVNQDDDFIIVPTGKYEMIIRESERMRMIERYLYSESPKIGTVKILAEV